MDGSLGSQARQTQKYARRLATALELPIEYVDERLTSYQAEQLILAENRSPSRHKELIDRKAAARDSTTNGWMSDEGKRSHPRGSQLATLLRF